MTGLPDDQEVIVAYPAGLSHPVIRSSGHPLSLTGRPWRLREADERLVAAFTRLHDLPDLLARVLAARGIGLEEAELFLSPSLKASLPDPSHLLDMDAAAARIAGAVSAGETIAIFGDYDVDGATSSALLARYLQALGCKPLIYIPDRMTEGYGPNAKALLGLQQQGATLVITVDCGTMAFEPLQAAFEAGLDVIVADHHIGEARKPKAYAIVNPNRLDETSPHGQLAAVGVCFLLAVAVNRVLRKMGFFTSPSPNWGEGRGGGLPGKPSLVSPLPNPPPETGEGIKEPDLRQWLDLVAVGTVCDVVPLTGVNRAFVAQGLKILAARGNLGLRTVLDMAASAGTPGVYACGFLIGPRINAGGRVGKADLGVRLLSTSDEAEAMLLARELELHNAERKAIEAMVLEQAMAQAEALDDAMPVMLVAGNGWHPGVIGIVAGRLKERFHKPAAVIALHQGVGKASARSVAGFDFGAAVIAAHAAGLLLGGGGHAMAAGFSVEEAQIPALAAFFMQRMSGMAPPSCSLTLDGIVSIGGATIELLTQCERLGPFGQGNPSLRLMVENVVNLRPEIVGEHHVKTLLIDRLSSARLPAIAFRAVGTKLGDALLSTRGKSIDAAGQLKIQEWNGRQSVNMTIDDVRLSGGD